MTSITDLRALIAALKSLEKEWKPGTSLSEDLEKHLRLRGVVVLSTDPLRIQWGEGGRVLDSLPNLPPATLLISPNSLAIVDTLFRLEMSELNHFRSMLEFAKHHRLDQPKLSRLRRHFRARDLSELKQALSAIPHSDWVNAFDYPNSKKGLTSFYRVRRPFLPADSSKITHASIAKFFTSHALEEGTEWFPGPSAQPRVAGFLAEYANEYWVSEKAERALKKHLRLRPVAVRPSEPAIYLARPRRGLRQEAIVSTSPDYPAIENIFRTIWDLLQGEARLREIGTEVLLQALKK